MAPQVRVIPQYQPLIPATIHLLRCVNRTTVVCHEYPLILNDYRPLHQLPLASLVQVLPSPERDFRALHSGF